jgi:hypothetical protein
MSSDKVAFDLELLAGEKNNNQPLIYQHWLSYGFHRKRWGKSSLPMKPSEPDFFSLEIFYRRFFSRYPILSRQFPAWPRPFVVSGCGPTKSRDRMATW